MQGKQCQICVNYVGRKLCVAYPNGIPMEIFMGAVSHQEPQPGDGGIQFEEVQLDDQQTDLQPS